MRVRLAILAALALTVPAGPAAAAGGTDINLITGPETHPKVLQAGSVIWGEGNRVVAVYNDSRDSPSIIGVSVSNDGGQTFARLSANPFGTNFGIPSVLYNRKLASWFIFALSPGCGNTGIDSWTSPNGSTWTAGPCVHTGASDDYYGAAWVDNNPSSPYYGRMYVGYNNFALAGSPPQLVRSDDGASWEAPVNLAADFRRFTHLSGSRDSDGRVFAAVMTEGGGGLNGPRTHQVFNSTTGGTAWTGAAAVTGTVLGPGDSACPGNAYFPVITPNWRTLGWGQVAVGPGGVVHYAYALRAGGMDPDTGDVMYTRSTDNGASFSPSIQLNTDAGSRAQWMPSLAVTPSGTVSVSWYDRRNTTGTDYQRFVRASADNGVNWGPDEPLSDIVIPQALVVDPGIQSCFTGNQDQSFALGERTFFGWADGRNQVNGNQQFDVYVDQIPPQSAVQATGTGPAGTGAPPVAVIRQLSLKPKRFRAARAGPSFSAGGRPIGTRVSYRLSTASKLRFTVERELAGRRVGRRCRAPSRRNRNRRRCKRYKAVRGSSTVQGRAPSGSARFLGRMRGKALRRSRYRLVATPLAPDGRRGTARRAAFRIVRK